MLSASVSVVVPPSGNTDTPKFVVIAGADSKGGSMFNGADAVLPVPPFADVTALVTLTMLPTPAAPSTVTAKLQETPDASDAPESATLLDPATAVIVPPPQEPVNPLGVATTRPEGNVSVKPIPVSGPVFNAELLMINVRLVVPFRAICDAPNVFVMEGGTPTITLAEAVPPVPPSLDVTAPVVLFCTPLDIPVTLTLKVHCELALKIAPARLTLPAPAVAVIVPPPHPPV